MPAPGAGMKGTTARRLLPAVLGIALSIGPVLAAHVFPRAAGVRMLGACVLGGLISFGACRWR